MYISRLKLANLYLSLLVEDLDSKIIKVAPMVPAPSTIMGNRIESENDKINFVRWVAENFDPTKTKQYLTWLLRIITKNNEFRGEEDSYKVQESLLEYDRLKTKNLIPAEYKDINRIKSYRDLVALNNQYSDAKSKKEAIRAKEEEGIKLLAEDGAYKLYVVSSPEAACKYFKNTEWCVRDPRAFDRYDPKLFYLLTWHDTPQKLVHLNSGQCMDSGDNPTTLDEEEKALMASDEARKFIANHEPSWEWLVTYYNLVAKGDEWLSDLIKNIIIENMKEDIGNNISPEEFNSLLELVFDPKEGIHYNYTDEQGHRSDLIHKGYCKVPNMGSYISHFGEDEVNDFLSEKFPTMFIESFDSNGFHYQLRLEEEWDGFSIGLRNLLLFIKELNDPNHHYNPSNLLG